MSWRQPPFHTNKFYFVLAGINRSNSVHGNSFTSLLVVGLKELQDLHAVSFSREVHGGLPLSKELCGVWKAMWIYICIAIKKDLITTTAETNDSRCGCSYMQWPFPLRTVQKSASTK